MHLSIGTTSTDPLLIANGEQGLDSRYCNNGYYGIAAYTAEDAVYSHQYRYNVPDGSGSMQMFLVRVAAGTVHEVPLTGNINQVCSGEASNTHS